MKEIEIRQLGQFPDFRRRRFPLRNIHMGIRTLNNYCSVLHIPRDFICISYVRFEITFFA
jgi:hypothetical protein